MIPTRVVLEKEGDGERSHFGLTGGRKVLVDGEDHGQRLHDEPQHFAAKQDGHRQIEQGVSYDGQHSGRMAPF